MLRLTPSARNKFTSGFIFNLVTSDTEQIQLMCQNVMGLTSNPIRIVVAVILLYLQLGPRPLPRPCCWACSFPPRWVACLARRAQLLTCDAPLPAHCDLSPQSSASPGVTDSGRAWLRFCGRSDEVFKMRQASVSAVKQHLGTRLSCLREKCSALTQMSDVVWNINDGHLKDIVLLLSNIIPFSCSVSV